MADSYGTLLLAVLTDKVCEGVPDRVFSLFLISCLPYSGPLLPSSPLSGSYPAPFPVSLRFFPEIRRLLHRHLTQCIFLYPAEQPAFPTQAEQAVRDERSPAAVRC